MRTPMIGFVIVAIALSSTAFWGCSSSVQHRHTTGPAIEKNHPGPPPHAPAHGYRHKHSDGVILVYDSGIGVYLVNGHTSVYFYEGSYYRLHSGVWETSAHIDGKWRNTSHKNLPPGLQDKQLSKNKGKKK